MSQEHAKEGLSFRQSVDHMVDHAIDIMGLGDGMGGCP